MKRKKVSKRSDLPLECFTGKPRLEIMGNECLVDGLEGILEYTSERIKLTVGKKEITFIGDELYIESFSHHGAVIEGTIYSLEMSS